MLPRNHPGRTQIAFDDHRLVANAGLLLPVTLVQHLGLRELVDNQVDLGAAPGHRRGDRPYGCRTVRRGGEVPPQARRWT